jgi:hypothetical protein
VFAKQMETMTLLAEGIREDDGSEILKFNVRQSLFFIAQQSCNETYKKDQ